MASWWREEGIVGWVSYVFKEKLKRLKETLKGWNKSQFGMIDRKIDSLQEEIHSLDLKDDSLGLTEEEAIKRSEVAVQLLLQLNNRKYMLAQKAKS